MFSASVNGAKASANLYSLIETARANGLEPYAYLKRVFTEPPITSSFDDVDRPLPWSVKGVLIRRLKKRLLKQMISLYRDFGTGFFICSL